MFIKYFDILSSPLTLHYEKFHSHSSIPSSILSIITIILSIIFAIYFLKDMLFHLNPTIFSFTKMINDIGKFPINESSMFHYFTFNNFPKTESPENLIEIFGIMYPSETITNYKDNLGNRTIISHYTYNKCPNYSSKYKNNNIEKLIIDFPLINGFCINGYYDAEKKIFTSVNDKNFNYPIQEYGSSNPNFTSYQILIQKCQNDSYNNFNKCKSSDYIDKILFENQIDVILQMINHEVDVSNFTTPIINKFVQIKLTFSPLSNIFSGNNLNFKPLKIRRNKNIFYTKWFEENSFFLEQNDINNYFSLYPIYTTFQFLMQNNVFIYEIKYKKIQNFLTNIGGTINALIKIAKIINFIIYKYQTYKDIEKIMLKRIYNLKKTQSLYYKNDTSKSSYDEIKKGTLKYINSLNNSCNKLNNYINLKRINKTPPIKKNKSNIMKIISHRHIPFTFLHDNYSLGKKIGCFKIFCYLFIKPDNNKSKKGKYVDIIKWYYRQVVSEENLFDLYFFCSKIEKIEDTDFKPYDFVNFLNQ